ncbi:MAG: HAMP domain-containing histidine kinase [Lachnospiraceae bacterium]|nr:HAMP domain-containing histidine kinase [Lachnospiraceae bacterium]
MGYRIQDGGILSMVRFITLFVNIIAAIIAITTFSMIQIEFSQSDINSIMSSTSFETTEEFYNIVSDRIDESFSLINLKKAFEANNRLSYDALVAESVDKENGIKKWTISDCLNEAKLHGLTIDENYNVVLTENASTIPFSRNTLYNFMLKLYPSNIRVGAQSEEDFLTEFMESLAKYHKANRYLSKDLTNFHYIADFEDEYSEKNATYKNTELTEKNILSSPLFIYLSSKENIVSSSINAVNLQTLTNLESINPHPDMDFNVYYAIDNTYPINDDFQVAYLNYTRIKNRCASLITYTILFAFLFILTLIVNMYLTLKLKKNVDDNKSILSSTPTEIYIFLYIFAVAIAIFIARKVSSPASSLRYNFTNAAANFYILAIYIPTIILSNILATKYADDALSFSAIKAMEENAQRNDNTINPKTLFLGTFIPVISFIATSIYLIHNFSLTNDPKILAIAFFIFIATLSFSIYILYLYKAFNKAIEVEARSNEMRTTLITNVTHDIKTPLTSILNYAEIITDEIQNPAEDSKERLTEYSNALINKSNRLNDLINDLIFESKISSGNIELDIQKINLNAFINQCIVEFEDKLSEKGLKIVYDDFGSQVNIAADSAQLYRVFQNLISNIYKYALENSRVYVELKATKRKVKITIKNIQKEKLEVDTSTLKNRFVRGSKSRSTEGFGLGLSITDSLINAMNGTFEIKSVKDQFTTIITFLLYEE